MLVESMTKLLIKVSGAGQILSKSHECLLNIVSAIKPDL